MWALVCIQGEGFLSAYRFVSTSDHLCNHSCPHFLIHLLNIPADLVGSTPGQGLLWCYLFDAIGATAMTEPDCTPIVRC